jgi:hypothetical protein
MNVIETAKIIAARMRFLDRPPDTLLTLERSLIKWRRLI